VISLEVNGKPNAYTDRPPAALQAFVRICTHYFSHAAWLEEGILLRNAHKLAGIPGVLIHGRLDLGSPLENGWQLASGLAQRAARRSGRLRAPRQRHHAQGNPRQSNCQYLWIKIF
jgi:hypothetical protein